MKICPSHPLILFVQPLIYIDIHSWIFFVFFQYNPILSQLFHSGFYRLSLEALLGWLLCSLLFVVVFYPLKAPPYFPALSLPQPKGAVGPFAREWW